MAKKEKETTAKHEKLAGGKRYGAAAKQAGSCESLYG